MAPQKKPAVNRFHRNTTALKTPAFLGGKSEPITCNKKFIHASDLLEQKLALQKRLFFLSPSFIALSFCLQDIKKESSSAYIFVGTHIMLQVLIAEKAKIKKHSMIFPLLCRKSGTKLRLCVYLLSLYNLHKHVIDRGI